MAEEEQQLDDTKGHPCLSWFWLTFEGHFAITIFQKVCGTLDNTFLLQIYQKVPSHQKSSCPSSTMGKKSDLCEFERGMIVGARQASLSISETANLLGYSCTTVCRIYREWTLKKKTCSGRQLCGRKSLVDDSGQKRMDRLVQSDSKATLAELTARYNEGLTKAISERTIRRTLKRLGYSKSPLGTTAAARASQKSTTSGQASSGQQPEATKTTDSVKVNQGGGSGMVAVAGEGCHVSQSLQ